MQAKPKAPKKVSKPEPSVVSAGSNPAGVIYVDQDSDITSIVSKIRQEPAKNIKLVIPKNSSALKSGVNLKLLKRTAHSKIKDLSLVTSDSKLIAMAAAAKIATAPNLTTDPSLATVSSVKINEAEDEPSPSSEDLEEDLTIDGSELDEKVTEEDAANATTGNKLKKDKSSKGKRVPNFQNFRKKALIGLGVFFGVIIIILLILTAKKSATIEVRANAKRLEVNFAAKLNENATETTKEELKVVKKSGSKSVTETTPATGEQNIGAKASGKVTLYNCARDDNDVTLSAGTTLSAGGLNYVTTSSVTVPVSYFTGSGTCLKNRSATVNVSAQNPGSQYNSSPRAYAVSGNSSITGQGTEMAGGTTQIVKVVSNGDIVTLNEKILQANADAYKNELKSQFTSSQKQLDETFNVALGNIQHTPTVGQQAEQVSGTVVVNYSMLGVEEAELKKILELRITDAKEDADQGIVKNGLEDLKLTPGGDGQFSFSTVAYLGPVLDQDLIKRETAGKKKGQAIQFIKSLEGVDDAKVKITPFWGSTLPGENKIEIKIEIAESSKNS